MLAILFNILLFSFRLLILSDSKFSCFVTLKLLLLPIQGCVQIALAECTD